MRTFSFKDLSFYFLRLGATGFGGPIALVGYMQRDLVEERQWFTKEEFNEGLALSQICPGPLATQLAIYLGWVRGGVLGATLAALFLILPAFTLVVALAALYSRYNGLQWLSHVFYGVGAAVLAIIWRSSWKLAKMSVGKDRALGVIFIFSMLITGILQGASLMMFLAGGLLALGWRTLERKKVNLSLVPLWLMTGVQGPAESGQLGRLFLYFSKVGFAVFGSGLAIVPFLYGGVVENFHWATQRQFLDAIAVGMVTPGPVVITVAFIGYLSAGFLGALTAALAVFLPCYLLVILLAPFYSRFAKNKNIRHFIDGVTATAAGAIAGSAFLLSRQTLRDWPAIAMLIAVFFVLWRFRKIPEPVAILGAGIVGIALRAGVA